MAVNESKRSENERKFDAWDDLPDGGRRYQLHVPGRSQWKAIYFKEVNQDETTVRFWQEIYNEKNELVEVHKKYPEDRGHQRT